MIGARLGRETMLGRETKPGREAKAGAPVRMTPAGPARANPEEREKPPPVLPTPALPMAPRCPWAARPEKHNSVTTNQRHIRTR